MIAGSFFALAAYVTVEASARSSAGTRPERSTVGIVLVAVSVVVMPFLSWAQRRAGRELGSASAVADSRQTLLCTYLSAAVLVGLVLNAALGWWWADPVVALGLAAIAIREGRSALHGQTCCPPVRLEHRSRVRLRGGVHGAVLRGRDPVTACPQAVPHSQGPAPPSGRTLVASGASALTV